MRIAVLDNDTTQADLICQVLNGAGHSCQSFDSGKELLGNLRKDSTDLLILDWQINDVPAQEVLRRAKEKMAANTPTMFLAGSASVMLGAPLMTLTTARVASVSNLP